MFQNIENNDNFVISPLSPQILLSCLVNEAKDTTRDEIKSAIQFQSWKNIEKTISAIQKEPTSRELKIKNAFFLPLNEGIR